MKIILALLFYLFQTSLLAQSDESLKIIDLSQIEIRLLNAFKTADSATKSKIFLDSIYNPHQKFWSGYAGKSTSFIKWMNKEGVVFLDYLNKRNTEINGQKLLDQFHEVKNRMKKMTGHSPQGKWYIVYFHGATDLGGLGSGEMLIDLSHENNASNENILKMFPHEITHQIMNNVNKNKDTTALNSIIGEGFAVYMNQLYWGNKYSLAQNLAYTDQELEECNKQLDLINLFFKENWQSTEIRTINKFRARYDKLNAQLPGAIGYYVGYKIIQAYVKKHGKNSWKHVFKKSPLEIYKRSGY